MPITALYAGLLAPLFILLSIRVIDVRRTARISIGHGDDPELLRRMRVHANFAEYAPFALIRRSPKALARRRTYFMPSA